MTFLRCLPFCAMLKLCNYCVLFFSCAGTPNALYLGMNSNTNENEMKMFKIVNYCITHGRMYRVLRRTTERDVKLLATIFGVENDEPIKNLEKLAWKKASEISSCVTETRRDKVFNAAYRAQVNVILSVGAAMGMILQEVEDGDPDLA